MMPWSGLSQTSVKHAYEMGTSELHRTSIMLAAIALTTNRSKYPKDLSQRLCEKAGRTRRPKSTALADHSVCAKSLDRSGPVTEVLTLYKAPCLTSGRLCDACVQPPRHKSPAQSARMGLGRTH